MVWEMKTSSDDSIFLVAGYNDDGISKCNTD